MKISLRKLLNLVGIITISIFSFAAKKAEPVNGECPYSGKAVKADKVLTFNVCCNNCVKKASADVKGLVKKVKAENKKCPFPTNRPKRRCLSLSAVATVWTKQVPDSVSQFEIK